MYTILDCQNVPTSGFVVLSTYIFDDVPTSGLAKCTYFWILKMYILLDFQNVPTSVVPNSGLQYVPTSDVHNSGCCLRRSLPQAYKPLFSFISSKVEILKEMTNKLKKCYDTKLIGMINKVC